MSPSSPNLSHTKLALGVPRAVAKLKSRVANRVMGYSSSNKRMGYKGHPTKENIGKGDIPY